MRITPTHAALAAGLAYLWWRSRGPSEAEARALQSNVLMPQVTPTGAPKRTADNPLSPDEVEALKSGAAYLNKNGWLTYVGIAPEARTADFKLGTRTATGGMAW